MSALLAATSTFVQADPAADVSAERIALGERRNGSPAFTPQQREALALAFRYLRHWSAPNDVMIATASSFYGPTVTFHGRTRTLDSVLAEKRRFAERWPHRSYRHRPGTAEVRCEAGRARCTIRSSFDFSATNAHLGRHSSGMGEHELVVTLSGGRPVIASETSRVVLRGQGNMTGLLEEAL